MNINSFVENGTTLFVGTTNGIFSSTNNGNTWLPVSNGLLNFNILSLAVSGSNIFAGTLDGGIYLSTNNGSLWYPVNNGISSLNSIYSIAVSGSVVYAGSYGGQFYLTTNNGANWVTRDIPFAQSDVSSIVFSGSNIIIGTGSGFYGGNGVYLTTNSGLTWINKNQGLGNLGIEDLRVFGNYIFAGTAGSSVWRRQLSDIIGIQNISSQVPDNFHLSQNYPNPFNPTTNINFTVPKSGFVKMNVYDINGREISTLVNQEMTPGSYKVDFDGSNLSSGIYYYTMTSRDFIETKKMMLVK